MSKLHELELYRCMVRCIAAKENGEAFWLNGGELITIIVEDKDTFFRLVKVDGENYTLGKDLLTMPQELKRLFKKV